MKGVPWYTASHCDRISLAPVKNENEVKNIYLILGYVVTLFNV